MLEASEPPGDGRKAAVADRRSPVASRRSASGDRRSAMGDRRSLVPRSGGARHPLCLLIYFIYLLYLLYLLTLFTYLLYLLTQRKTVFSAQIGPLKLEC